MLKARIAIWSAASRLPVDLQPLAGQRKVAGPRHFGIGNAPAIFMVVVALFFHMVLATVSQIDGVNRNLINVARKAVDESFVP
jgi:hypothetical protein